MEEGRKAKKGEREEEEGQGQSTGSAWWRKLQIVNEYLWDPEKRMSLARTGQSRSKSHSSQCLSLVSLVFWYGIQNSLDIHWMGLLQTPLNISQKDTNG